MYRTTITVPNAHTDSLFCVAWAPGKQRNEATDTSDQADIIHEDILQNGCIATGSMDETVKIWGTESARVEDEKNAQAHTISTFKENTLGVVSVAFNKDGTKLAANSMDSHIRVYDVEKGEMEQFIDCGVLNSWKLAYHPDGRHLATGTHGGQIHIWNTETGELASTLDTHGDFATTVQYSPDGRKVASGSSKGLVYVLDVESGKLIHKIEAHSMAVRSVAFSPDGGKLYSASDDGRINAYDVGGESHTSSLVYGLFGHLGWVLSVDARSDGIGICSGSSDKTVKLWDTRSRECSHTYEAHTEPVWGVAYNEHGTRIASVGDDARLCVHQG
eukprot:gb/GECG01007867.1/.p1 GENE.gb/GECG01007867.1/~~gb/GECG01007867.1/.p1  ORF type:complete len:331 (+),score=40.74 gb/GECG01007867.1/:1-993(+)